MKIKGIPFALKSPVAVRLVKKFLGEVAKNLYRNDAKNAKKQQTILDFLFSFTLFASSRWECFILHFRVIPCSSVANAFFASLLFRVHPWQMLLFAYRR